MLTVLWIALFLLVVLALALAATKRRRQRRGDRLLGPWPLQVRRQLLSERQLALFSRLVQSLPEHIVLSQVHLLQVVEFWPGGRTQALFNRISQLSIDFLVVNADTSIVAAIELDEGRYRRRVRPWADARKTHALKCAGVPLIRWRAWSLPDTATIRAAVLQGRAPSEIGRE
jgi:hypothetical protein